MTQLPTAKKTKGQVEHLSKFRTNDVNKSKSETLTIWKCPYCQRNKWVNKNQIHEHLEICKKVSEEKKHSNSVPQTIDLTKVYINHPTCPMCLISAAMMS